MAVGGGEAEVTGGGEELVEVEADGSAGELGDFVFDLEIHDNSIPYWKRAHRDWRMWTAAFFVFAALAIYIVTVDLALVPRSHAASVTVGK